MAFILNSATQIGRYFFKGINEVIIRKSIYNIVDTATLKIPGKSEVRTINNAVVTALKSVGLTGGAVQSPSSVHTADLFNEGDPVSIDLGYNGDLRKEFKGFVRRVNQTTPLSIEMEGYAWQLRNQNILASWKTITLREVLVRIIQGTDIILSPDIPVVNLTNFTIRHRNGLDALVYLKEKMLLTVYFDNETLYVGLEEGRKTAVNANTGSLLAEVVYNIGYNVISNQPDLKRRLGKDNLVRVRLKTCGKDGKHTLYEAGDIGGAVYKKIIPYSTDKTYLQSLANARLKQLKYDGYSGKIIGFLQPYCQPGWKARIIDKAFNNSRSGTYFITGTEVTFGVKGARRIASISYRLDVPIQTTN